MVLFRLRRRRERRSLAVLLQEHARVIDCGSVSVLGAFVHLVRLYSLDVAHLGVVIGACERNLKMNSSPTEPKLPPEMTCDVTTVLDPHKLLLDWPHAGGVSLYS